MGLSSRHGSPNFSLSKLNKMSDINIDESKRLTAYNSKTKKKGELMFNVTINKVENGGRTTYAASGTTQDGKQRLSTLVSAVGADEAINAGVASRGVGWED